jgi:hypothetical protein
MSYHGRINKMHTNHCGDIVYSRQIQTRDLLAQTCSKADCRCLRHFAGQSESLLCEIEPHKHDVHHKYLNSASR